MAGKNYYSEVVWEPHLLPFLFFHLQVPDITGLADVAVKCNTPLTAATMEKRVLLMQNDSMGRRIKGRSGCEDLSNG